MALKVPEDIEVLVQARVEAGGFASPEEVLRDAMKPRLDAEQQRQEKLRAARTKIAEGDADPVDSAAAEVSSRLDALAAKLTGRAA
ncbi:hypothetical protein DWF00_14450 [Bosea caraganae]|uniref:Type II toxin-antitoxin system ParD family antitoxin n=1 Tax=Bosea caraganae TaxID=2763117 RepID=A0A370KY28_9HYPH|nr:hypothetical protein [Bosea caraganae]RDJ19880.1 hypothetical protein DWE98_27625 [Bosea caraganae]RDJ25610.1 hypothetical protein DWF00_14450 [Bosea caraganae]